VEFFQIMTSIPAQLLWKVHQAENGIPYYYNTVTHQTTWMCPPELLTLLQPQQTSTKKKKRDKAKAMYAACKE
jgi:hypothetical protein